MNKSLIVYLPNSSSTAGSLRYSHKHFSISSFPNIFLEPHPSALNFCWIPSVFSISHFSVHFVCSEPIGQYAASFWIRPCPPLLQPLSCVALFHLYFHSKQTGLLAAPWAQISLSYLCASALALCYGEIFAPFLFLFIGTPAQMPLSLWPLLSLFNITSSTWKLL